MIDPSDGFESGSRRQFIRGAGVLAGGAAMLGGHLAAEAQNPREVPAQAPDGGRGRLFRASAPAGDHLRNLGPLAELGGTWVGHGFNLIALPDFQDNKTFRLKLSATDENLQFTQIGGPVPNRGSFTPDHKTGQKDINIFGVSYLQRVSDATTSSALHIEPGLWLHVEPSEIPSQPQFTVVRQGSIPHGTSILAQGPVIKPVMGPPIINPADSTPTADDGKPFPLGYLDPFSTAPIPPGAKATYVKDPNLALIDAIAGQNIVRTEVLDIATGPIGASLQGGGVLNIPFVDSNAKVTKFSAIFWIETVRPSDAPAFMQLQYTQTVILNFANVNWPHISVATLIKQ